MTRSTTRPAKIMVSVNDILDGVELPDNWTGIHWTDASWVECRAHIEDRSWRSQVERDDARTGRVLFGEVRCSSCDEARMCSDARVSHRARVHGRAWPGEQQ